jgi:hypothetical protein
MVMILTKKAARVNCALALVQMKNALKSATAVRMVNVLKLQRMQVP